MTTAEALQQVQEHKAVAVMRAPSAAGAVEACRAMLAGGMRLMEITTTTPDWEQGLEGAAGLEGILLGVGTLVEPAQVAVARSAGATFAVSPGWSAAIADACAREGLPYFPGVASPTEVMAAWGHEAVAALKLFPAGALGGAPYLKALRGPFPDIPFLPTGGVRAENAAEYMAAGAVGVGLSAVCKGDLIAAEKWDEIERLSRELMASLT
jgi:2-dehydro-3-deoxyphosphogluconate aldolase/(4S)-4-hydroxy-2-oxoglutarate aldolase